MPVVLRISACLPALTVIPLLIPSIRSSSWSARDCGSQRTRPLANARNLDIFFIIGVTLAIGGLANDCRAILCQASGEAMAFSVGACLKYSNSDLRLGTIVICLICSQDEALLTNPRRALREAGRQRPSRHPAA